MSEPYYPRDVVAQRLAVAPATLLRYESRGLVQVTEQGYGPTEVRRVWTIVTFQRDLGINLAGVEVILRLRDQLDATHHHLGRLARDLRSLADLDADGPLTDAESR